MIKIGNLEVYGIIYKITNKINGKVYIGQTTQGFNKRYKRKGIGIERVYNHHKYYKNRKNNKTFNGRLFYDIEKYGFDAFEIVKVFDFAFSEDELDIREMMWIKVLNSFENGYNRDFGGKGAKGVEKNMPKGKFNHSSKLIICLNDLREFFGAGEASRFYSIHQTSINDCCLMGRRYIKSDFGNLIFRYYDDYVKMSSEEISELLQGLKYEKDKVVCLNTRQVFNTMKEASRFYDIVPNNMGRCCNGDRNYCGVFNGEKLVWRYYNDYIDMSNDDIDKLIKRVNSPTLKCLTTGECFYQMKDAVEKYHLNRSRLTKACKGEISYCGELEDGTKLLWEYYNDECEE